MKRRRAPFKLLALSCLLGAACGAEAVTSPIDELVMVSIDQDSTNTVGTVNVGLSGSYDFAVRERSNAGQGDRRIVSYVKFDLSGLSTSLVNSVGFQSLLTLDYSTRLNTSNNGSVRVNQVAGSNTWSNVAGSYPLAEWHAASGAVGLEVINNIKVLDPAAATNEVVLDVTGWVQDWVNGTAPNNGLAFFIPGLQAQGAGFTFTSLDSRLYGTEITFTGALDSDWLNAGNWDSSAYPADTEVALLNMAADLSGSVPNDILAVRIGTDGTGTLNLLSGSALQATADSTYASQIGVSSNGIGVINQSGGSADFNYLEIGTEGSGTVNLSGGSLAVSGSSDGFSLFLGSGTGGLATVEVSGGALTTEAGVYLGSSAGSGAGTFSVQGAGATDISIGSEGTMDGDWYQNPGSTLRVGVSTNGVASILLVDAAEAGTPGAVFAPGSILDVAFIDGALETNSWPVLVSEGSMTDFGMVFDSAMGSTTNDWGFRIIDHTLYVGYGLGWSAGGEIVTGQSDLIDATFNGIADGLNESFSLLQNVLPGGVYTWSNETGEAAMTFTNFQPGAVGCVSDTSINGAAYNGLTAAFEINEIIHPDAGPSYNGHFVGLSGNNTQLFNNAQLEVAPDAWAVGIQFLGGSVSFVYDNTNGNEVVMGSLGTYTVDSLKDGYSARMVMDTNGWSVAVNGIDTAVGGSGVWPAGFDYSWVQDDPDVFAAMSYQGNISNALVDVTAISVSGIIGSGDNDNDDIPNAYETANGLDPEDPSDRDTDLDGDGLSNYEEYVAGTAANDPASVLKLTAADSMGGDFVITWQSVAGKNYSVITNLNLVSGTEGTAASGIVGQDGETSYTTTVSGASAVFYKIGVE
ncbi:hypothetical protein [Pontiella sp.]|uniref:hypothetical protein n=1 Tax=Pontiella sp. TaxID=2837462 RepID=UPI0035691740